MKVCCNTSSTFLNNPKDLDPSYKTDYSFWIAWKKKRPSNKQRRNTIPTLTPIVSFAQLFSIFIMHHMVYKTTEKRHAQKFNYVLSMRVSMCSAQQIYSAPA